MNITPENIEGIQSFEFSLGNTILPVWLGELDRLARVQPDMAAFLSKAECQRAAQFKFPSHREQYVAVRWFERTLLGQLLAIPAQAVYIDHTPLGKPYLPHSELRYSVAHSGNLAVLTVASCNVGIDIEHLRDLADVDQLTSRQFFPADAARILNVPRERRSSAFLRHWTLCEAVLKATGEGLQGSIRELRFSSEDGGQVRASNRSCHARQLVPSPGIIGAIAITS